MHCSARLGRIARFNCAPLASAGVCAPCNSAAERLARTQGDHRPTHAIHVDCSRTAMVKPRRFAEKLP
eukprot:13320998-Alexandrium_andersonii.AAC.1